MEEKLVTYKHLKIGQEIKGTEEGNCYRCFVAFVKSINPSYVAVEMWSKGGAEERIGSSCRFRVEMTEKEFNAKYHSAAKEVMQGIQNKLHGDEIGYHEMWNSWLYGTPYEIASQCVKNKMKIVGHSTDIIPKYAMFGADLLDVGVCAEYEDGERFWCHFRSENIEAMVERYKDLLE